MVGKQKENAVEAGIQAIGDSGNVMATIKEVTIHDVPTDISMVIEKIDTIGKTEGVDTKQ